MENPIVLRVEGIVCGQPLDAVALEALESAVLEAAVDRELAEFDAFFSRLGSAMVGPEKALLKTYLWFKTHPEGARKRLHGK